MTILTIRRFMKDMIKLQNAHITQHTNGHIKSDWSIEENITDEKLASFESTVGDKLMFKILNFAREFELEAFNVGISYGKKVTVDVYAKKIDNLMEAIGEMRAENERLSTALQKEMFKHLPEEI